MNLKIYTDGACINNLGLGGYAYVVYNELQEVCLRNRGTQQNTTHNRMELIAVIEGLSAVNKGYGQCNLVVCSDSAYVVNCFNDSWISKWKKNGWVNNSKKPVSNRDLWEALDVLVKKMNVKFERVSRKDPRLIIADRDASLAIKELRKNCI